MYIFSLYTVHKLLRRS